MFSSVRWRLTLWYVGVLGIVLITFSIGVYMLLARSLYDRVDTRLASTLQASVSAVKHALTERGTSVQAVTRALQDLHFPSQTIAVLDADGRVLAEKTGVGGPPLRLPPAPVISSERTRFYETPESHSDADDSSRGILQRVTDPRTAAPYTVVVVQSLEALGDQLELLLEFLYIVVPLSLILAGLGGWFLARKSLAPVVAMSERAQRISVENLDQRLPIINPRDELGHLAATFNDLLARLSKSFAQQRRFMADASHELRTPLSAIRTASAVMLQQHDREKSEYREALTIVEHEARRLTRIVEDMFVLARADAGHPTLQKTSFYLDEVIAESARAAAVLASQKNLQFEALPLPEAPFSGDEGLLRQMLWNLLDNAIKYTPDGGRVQIALEARDTHYAITVSDTGNGIPPELQARIFERFYRVDEARAHTQAGTQSGAGLGLPIARWIAQVHGGRIELSRSDPTGSAFVVLLPRT